MARKRVIDTEGLFLDVELWEMLGERGILFYIRLWGIAEDWGGIELHPKKIALQMGMLNCTEEETKQFLDKLIKSGHIIPYERDQKQYGWLKNILKYQPLKNPALPNLPLPPWIRCEIKKYKSGKKYAVYTVINETVPQHNISSLPVDYQYPTGSPRNETETKRNEIETHTNSDTDGVCSLFCERFNLKPEALKPYLNNPRFEKIADIILFMAERNKQVKDPVGLLIYGLKNGLVPPEGYEPFEIREAKKREAYARRRALEKREQQKKEELLRQLQKARALLARMGETEKEALRNEAQKHPLASFLPIEQVMLNLIVRKQKGGEKNDQSRAD